MEFKASKYQISVISVPQTFCINGSRVKGSPSGLFRACVFVVEEEDKLRM